MKSILKPEASTMIGLATVAAVYGVYQVTVGPVSTAQATDANHPALERSRKKAGWTSLVLVASLTLITKDANVGILGAGSIIAMELTFKTGIMSNPFTGRMVNPATTPAFEPAENVIPMPLQGETG